MNNHAPTTVSLDRRIALFQLSEHIPLSVGDLAGQYVATTPYLSTATLVPISQTTSDSRTLLLARWETVDACYSGAIKDFAQLTQVPMTLSVLQGVDPPQLAPDHVWTETLPDPEVQAKQSDADADLIAQADTIGLRYQGSAMVLEQDLVGEWQVWPRRRPTFYLVLNRQGIEATLARGGEIEPEHILGTVDVASDRLRKDGTRQRACYPMRSDLYRRRSTI